MSPRTRGDIADVRRLVALIWAVSPGSAFDFVAARRDALDPDDGRFHPFRQAFEAGEDALVHLFRTTFLDIPGALI